MNKYKLIFLKNAVKFYFYSTIMFFGGSVLIKHYIFHSEMDHGAITENLFTSLFIGILFTIGFRQRWDIKGRDVNLLVPGNEQQS